ncbi:MAG TPA: sugar kinase [Sphingopyxis sp.]|nr:sugar kinase [Sphingopyxis sp.]
MTIVCFGEMLLRLAPADGAALDTADGLSLHVAGAEANVAISLASLGTAARMATILPDNALGARALRTLTRHGVDTAACARRPGRMGLFYIESPRAGREGGFFYDRAGSAFAREAAAIDWDAALEGANWLHLSGLTAALGNEAVSAMRQSVANARRRDLSISFDCNFRPLLWQGREAEAAGLLREFAGAAHLLFASDWDAGLLLGEEAQDRGAARLLASLPDLRWIASTSRMPDGEEEHLGATLISRTGSAVIGPAPITPFVDRVGAGDAFAAALLHALASGWDEARALRFAHRACLMKHAVPGDFSIFSEAEVADALTR